MSFELQPRFKKEGKTYRPITYIADFVVYYEDKTYVIDTKGAETTEFKLKKKLFEYKFPYSNRRYGYDFCIHLLTFG